MLRVMVEVFARSWLALAGEVVDRTAKVMILGGGAENGGVEGESGGNASQ